MKFVFSSGGKSEGGTLTFRVIFTASELTGKAVKDHLD
jgi:hypothetical protein